MKSLSESQKKFKKLNKEIEEFRNGVKNQRNRLVCAARGCDGCRVCEPEKFKLNKYRLVD